MPIDFSKLSDGFAEWYEKYRKESDMSDTKQLPMTNTRGFWATHGTNVTYVQDKAEMVRTGEVFTITHVKEGKGQFGPRWEVSILRSGIDEEQVLTFARNNARDAMMEDLRAELQTGYINASLEVFPTKSGQEAYALCPPKDGSADDEPQETADERSER